MISWVKWIQLIWRGLLNLRFGGFRGNHEKMCCLQLPGNIALAKISHKNQPKKKRILFTLPCFRISQCLQQYKDNATITAAIRHMIEIYCLLVS